MPPLEISLRISGKSKNAYHSEPPLHRPSLRSLTNINVGQSTTAGIASPLLCLPVIVRSITFAIPVAFVRNKLAI
jgi:hypothetical protein